MAEGIAERELTDRNWNQEDEAPLGPSLGEAVSPWVRQGNIDNKEFAVNGVIAEIKEYFNMMLGTHLLYKFERLQYAPILNVPSMSQDYGAPHLLRLFIRIRAISVYMPFEKKSLT
ncbi:hypothetical protein QTO34_000614 [Cnephaeus nilssonii]|uniref:Mortality factor 4-like protein 2 n=1 Tax=Cnephaeus nilssonii TaxID=3371016 RepID=A0AA40LX20_CNENI|nr:hypothetical protein QTO34_000614 [Eptesicus nilssonii]